MISLAPPPSAALGTPVLGWSGPATGSGDRVRRALVLAAARRMAVHGVPGVSSLRRVAADARVSWPAARRCVRSRDALADAVLDEAAASWAPVRAEIDARDLDPLWRLLVETDAVVARRMFDPVVLGARRWLRESPEDTGRRAAALQEAEERVAALLVAARDEGLLRAGVDPAATARTVGALLAGHDELAATGPVHPVTPTLWHRMSDAWRGLLPAVAVDPWLDGWAGSTWATRPAPSSLAHASARRP